jgi:EAL domain-containing protein (putative c-di-GMP-specific phosphodiesterase class I)
MAFQPIVDIVDHRIKAHEALVRGPNGESADSILRQVNSGNLYAFDQACRVRAIEMAAGLGLDRGLNINFLPNAVYEAKTCIRRSLETAARTGLSLDQLTFEIVEGETISDIGHLRSIVTEYRRHGLRIALDDFGTAYSGLARLAELRPETLKLDRALVTHCDLDITRRAIIASVNALVMELGMTLIAEGLERREEVEALRDMGIRYMQGYYFARPRFEGLASDAEVFAAGLH